MEKLNVIALTVIILSTSVQAMAWSQRIKVVDKDNEPIIGAVIQNPNTQKTVVSNLDGIARIEANNGDFLTAAFVGYITDIVPAKEDETIVITLEEYPLTKVSYFNTLLENSKLVELAAMPLVKQAFGPNGSVKIIYDPRTNSVSYIYFLPGTLSTDKLRAMANATMAEMFKQLYVDGEYNNFIDQVKSSGVSLEFLAYTPEGKYINGLTYDPATLENVGKLLKEHNYS